MTLLWYILLILEWSGALNEKNIIKNNFIIIIFLNVRMPKNGIKIHDIEIHGMPITTKNIIYFVLVCFIIGIIKGMAKKYKRIEPMIIEYNFRTLIN